MNQSKWYLISPECNFGMQDLKDTHGMYFKERILPVGSIVPFEWKGRQRIQDLYLPMNYLTEYEPTEEDIPILYALWPSLRPLKYRGVVVENHHIGSPDNWASGWYKIAEPDELRGLSSVPYAYAALCDVEGICRAGDLAFSGDIIPPAFFAGLSTTQFERLESIGLASESWLNTWPRQYRVGYMRMLARPVMERVGVTKEQKDELLAKFPALAPKEETKTVVKTRKRKD
jgi:hypothetical protein